eukprot:403361980
MYNEDVNDQYTEEEGTENQNNGASGSMMSYEEEEEEDEEYQKIRRDHVFAEIDYTNRKSKIICTLGPSTCEVEQIIKLIDEGMACARFNLSHGTAKTNQRLLKKFQEAKRLRPHKTCALMLEVRGREIRTSEIDEKSQAFVAASEDTQFRSGIQLKAGQQLFISSDNLFLKSDEKTLQCNYRELPKLVKPNDVIHLDDGRVVCLVTDVEHNGVHVEVKGGGILGSRVNIKLPSGRHDQLPILTAVDEVDVVNYAVKNNFDFIALPYAVRKRDIQQVKDLLGPAGAHIQILAKIDTVDSLHNFEELVKAADGIILNRVEVGLELPAEKLMLAQKWMIDRTVQEGKPIFLQSQVLESMIQSDLASRSDAEDVTSAILEGVDSFILSHETSIGKYPIQSVVQLAKCIAEGENIYDYDQVYNDIRQDSVNNSKNLTSVDLLATTACTIAIESNVEIFVCLTETGRIARYVAKYRPFQKVLACSTSSAVVKQANMTRGVIGYKIPTHLKKLSDKLIGLVLKVAKEQELCIAGNKVLIFYTENEGKKNESVHFKLVDIEQD